MESNLNIKNIERRIKELAKEYENKGYSVFMNPNQELLPSFLKGFEPDLIVSNDNESVIIEVKSRQDLSDLKRYEDLASIISKMKGWRFELVFTNPTITTFEKSTSQTLSIEEIKLRLVDVQNLIDKEFTEASFLLCWSTLEAAMRYKLEKENFEGSNKPTSYVFKSIFSFGLINQHDYKTLETLFKFRSNLVHGFIQDIEKSNVTDLINIAKYLIGDSIEAEIQIWLESLDLEYYDDVYSLYLTVENKDDYGGFTYEQKNERILIKADDMDTPLILNSEEQRRKFAELIEEEYMDGMSPEGWYAFNKAMEKDD
ncbi:MAG: hypothetical protein WC622_03610 [Pedobacter sp.]|jgi:Holliday junction resolvase|uniref:hypothetical protein n=1 Tax=Pedobacter sp. TaxID=1411316 RepID=UPI00356680D3